MEKKQDFNYSQENVEKILAGRKVISEAGLYPEAIAISNVSYTDGDGNPWLWKDSEGEPDPTRPYAIVNLQALTEEAMTQAEEYYNNGEYELAIRRRDGEGVSNLSVNMSPEDVAKLKLAKGVLVSATFDWRLNSEGDEVLACTSVAPLIAKKGVNTFTERLKAKKAQAKAEKEGDGVATQSTSTEQA